MKRYIRSSTNIKNGSYMLSKTGEVTPVYFHAPSTTYESRGIYHLCPTDADFLVSQKQISKEDGIVIIATGPLTSDGLSQEIAKLTGNDKLYFYDAAAPIVTKESIDMTKAYKKARYEGIRRTPCDYFPRAHRYGLCKNRRLHH